MNGFGRALDDEITYLCVAYNLTLSGLSPTSEDVITKAVRMAKNVVSPQLRLYIDPGML